MTKIPFSNGFAYLILAGRRDNINLSELRQSIIGSHTIIDSPFGKRLLTYADYTASGRLVQFIEDYLLVLGQYYGNTHTDDSYTGKVMNALMKQAYQKIKKSLNLTDDYYLIPCGFGTTAAIHKLCQILGLYLPPALKRFIEHLLANNRNYHQQFEALLKEYPSKRPVIFVSSYEHHSNYLIWKESLGEVIEIKQTDDGRMDLNDLEEKLKDNRYKGRMKIGSFSAASNVTGIKTDIVRVTRLMKRYKGYVFFDFAAAAPYVDMKISDDNDQIDAFFFSPHKLLGGPGGCGLLIIHRSLYDQYLPPTISGGGTVQYVSPHHYHYLSDVETRENAGTPPILQLFKTALALELKDQVGVKRIESIDNEYLSLLFRYFSSHSNIILYGPKDLTNRLPIVSFNIRDQHQLLHPKFVATLLNDLFGIQTRAGCACAGPYGHRLLGINKQQAKHYDRLIKAGYEIFRPGFVRLNLHFTMDKEEVLYIIHAVLFIASYGHTFLSLYTCDVNTGEWNHQDQNNQSIKLDLKEAQKTSSKSTLSTSSRHLLYQHYLKEAYNILSTLPPTQKMAFKDNRLETHRWFSFVYKKNSTT